VLFRADARSREVGRADREPAEARRNVAERLRSDAVASSNAQMSFFRRVTRYPPLPSLNRSENRLTEGFVGVLEQAPDLATSVLDSWSIPHSNHPLTIKTQVPTRIGLDVVDIEISSRDVRVWVEVKHRSPLGQQQLERYRSALYGPAHKQSTKCLVLLAPAGFAEPGAGEVQAADIVGDWQGLGVTLEGWRHAHPAPVSDWLIAEYVRFLEEEGLCMTSSEYVSAVVHRDASAELFQHLIAEAHATIEKERGTPADVWPDKWPKPSRTCRDWPDFYATWEPGHRFGDSLLEWNLWRRSFASGALLVGAGLTVHGDEHGQPGEPLNDEVWATARQQHDNFDIRLDERHWRLFRWLEPAFLLGQSLEGQVQSISSWVLGTFNELEADPPKGKGLGMFRST
jgi:hypothetical protein